MWLKSLVRHCNECLDLGLKGITHSQGKAEPHLIKTLRRWVFEIMPRNLPS
jgi:hypothetical protein